MKIDPSKIDVAGFRDYLDLRDYLDQQITSTFLCGVDAGSGLLGGCTTAAANTATASTLSLEEMLAIVQEIPPAPPPLGTAERCGLCHEEMSKPAMVLTSGPGMFAPPVAYLCGRCTYLAKYHSEFSWGRQGR